MSIRHTLRHASFVAAVSAGLALSVPAQQMTVMTPAKTGIPGEEVRHVVHGPQGDVWVGARWPFWGHGGVGLYDRVDREWSTYANTDHAAMSAFVNDIEFDAQGVAWIATGEGLVRFDGESFTRWDSGNSPMTLDVVNDLSIAPDGTVWFNSSSTSSGGDAIYSFDGVSAWRRYAVPDQIPFAAPWSDLSEVFVDSGGVVWVANQTLSGVARFDGRQWTLLGGSLDRFNSMAEDGFGNLWLASNLVGGLDRIYRYDGSQFTSYPFDEVTTLASDPDSGALYAGNWFGTVRRTLDGGASFETFLSGLNIIDSIAPDPAGDEVWVATLGAVGRFGPGGGLLEDFNTWNTGFPDYFVGGFRNDNQGNFWVTTGEAGLTRFDGRRWRNWGNHNVGSEPYPFAGNEPMDGVYDLGDGSFWFGGNGIARWHSDTGTFDGFWNWQNNPGMGVTRIPWFVRDAAGDSFAVTNYGNVYRFNEATQLWDYVDHPAYAASEVPGVQEVPGGGFWLCGWFDAYQWNGTGFDKLPLPYPDYFYDLGGVEVFRRGPDGTLWFGTVDGLVRYADGQFTLFDSGNSPMPANFVTGFAVRDDGLLGFTARGSGPTLPSAVCVVDGDPADPANWTLYENGSSPLPHWQTSACAFDPQGDLWVSTISEGAAVVHTGTWTDLGAGLAGDSAEPYLKGFGLAQAGLTASWMLSRAQPGGTATLVVGASTLDVPFKGGTLVPSPTVLLSLPTDADGELLLETVWPAGLPGGFPVFVQAWMGDPAGPAGFTASNAVQLDVP